ncbi:unnamed protein product [Tuwongella immobilis]|uniref:Uncharacterized protein n=1 Tax=Tuwongella immobilis TaxID=692036 RepID=A0A6C2YR72_9BACT|nr:unnamed protein product [Tuwongella immobilis]VTS04686.1 unnamed protein product [Tuwongella immobilis]
MATLCQRSPWTIRKIADYSGYRNRCIKPLHSFNGGKKPVALAGIEPATHSNHCKNQYRQAVTRLERWRFLNICLSRRTDSNNRSS